MPSIIDRDSPIPAYYQIQMDLKERIGRGEWAKTGLLPAESKLADDYAVSRITLRQALAELEKDGIIKKTRGRGAKICKNPKPFVHKLDYSLVTANRGVHGGHNITAEMLSIQRYDRPYPEVCEQLHLNPSTPVVYMKRLFSLEDKPLAIGRSWLSLHKFPMLDEKGLDNNQLSSTLLSRYNVRAHRVEDSVEAVRPTPSDCQLLDITYDCPLLLVRGVSYDAQSSPIEYSTTLWLGDRVRFKITMLSGPDGFHAVD